MIEWPKKKEYLARRTMDFYDGWNACIDAHTKAREEYEKELSRDLVKEITEYLGFVRKPINWPPEEKCPEHGKQLLTCARCLWAEQMNAMRSACIRAAEKKGV